MAPVHESPSPQVVKKIFKFVTGVLIKAFSSERLPEYEQDIRSLLLDAPLKLQFSDACEALANCIKAGHIPAQGVEVVKTLLFAQSTTVSVALLEAVGLECPDKIDLAEQDTCTESEKSSEAGATEVGTEKEVPEPDAVDQATAKPEPTMANRLFKFVTSRVRGVATDATDDFQSSCDTLAECVNRGEIPKQGLDVLIDCKIGFHESEYSIEKDTPLSDALAAYLCPQCQSETCRAKKCDICEGSFSVKCSRCRGSGRFAPPCRSCDGTGKGRTKMYCPSCAGAGKKDLGPCNSCQGQKGIPCTGCQVAPIFGKARPLCEVCAYRNRQAQVQAQSQGGKGGGKGFQNKQEVPKEGVSISKCTAGDLTRLQDLWTSRNGNGEVIGAWKVDNPLLIHKFKQRLDQLKQILKREPDTLDGFHGTLPANVISISSNGFDKGRRAGQVYGAGEYFAKNPTVSIGYSRGGQYMLVCRLSFGVQSSTPENKDGDHIWVPSNGYYVVKEPDQVLPQYIIKFRTGQSYHGGPVICDQLEASLANGFSTKAAEQIVPVPRQQRPCKMSRETATVLWMGFLHAHLSDESLRQDVNNFLHKHAASYMDGAKIQVVKGHYKKAHAILKTPIPRELVHKLNTAPFIENGVQRTICVEDAHGSPGQKCPRFIAGYCRGQNLRFTHPCFCSHELRATQRAHYTLEPIDLHGAKGAEICDKFMASAPFHRGQPKIVGIKAIKNDVLSWCHEEYRQYLRTKHMDEPAVQELYHGTNNNITDVLYQHGLQPPSDIRASPNCPVSGGKGLSTTLCDNTCRFCTEKHTWSRCHMYGLGIYLADMAQKSHRYCSQPKIHSDGRQTYRMIVCSVLGKSFQIEGHLKSGTAMHDVVNVRALDEEELEEMIDPCKAASKASGVGASIAGLDGSAWGRVVADEGHCWRLHTGRIAKKDTEGTKWKWCATEEVSAENREGSAEKSDLLFVKGLGDRCRPGFSVVNSEFIAFHPHQCLPKYEIEYEIGSGW
jgi:hypothetical protein